MLRTLVLQEDDFKATDDSIRLSNLNETAKAAEAESDLIIVVKEGTLTILKNRLGPVGEVTSLSEFAESVEARSGRG